MRTTASKNYSKSIRNNNYLLTWGALNGIGSFVQDWRKKLGLQIVDTVDLEIQFSGDGCQFVMKVSKADGKSGVAIENGKALKDFVLNHPHSKEFQEKGDLYSVCRDGIEYLMERINVRSIRLMNLVVRESVYYGELDKNGKEFGEGF